MKLKNSAKTKNPKVAATKPDKNQSKRNMSLLILVALTAVLLIWVYSMGRKAEETVQVIMYAEAIYKNEAITQDKIVPYDMLVGEFEKYAVEQSDGTKKRRILLWEERDQILNTFAAYPLKANTVAEYRDMIRSRVDNSDNVLYSYPGKNIVTLDVGDDDLRAFKTFLQPGDRINVVAIYQETERMDVEDEYGGKTTEMVDVFREETVFPDIMLADLLNSRGDSILDIYASYRDKTVYQQAQLDSSDTFQESVTPSTMLVALTPEEEVMYYYYLGKDSVSFRISLPQRTE